MKRIPGLSEVSLSEISPPGPSLYLFHLLPGKAPASLGLLASPRSVPIVAQLLHQSPVPNRVQQLGAPEQAWAQEEQLPLNRSQDEIHHGGRA